MGGTLRFGSLVGSKGLPSLTNSAAITFCGGGGGFWLASMAMPSSTSSHCEASKNAGMATCAPMATNSPSAIWLGSMGFLANRDGGRSLRTMNYSDANGSVTRPSLVMPAFFTMAITLTTKP